MKRLLLVTFLAIMVAKSIHAQDTIKIMPVGNSITAGEHYHEPALEERTGYRKDLYEMLIDSGYVVDFVGSQTHGIRPLDDEDWYDWNNEAYPGWEIPDIAAKVEIALGTYKPDMLLVHLGTNGTDWNAKPGQVEDMLDMINTFSVNNDHPMTVFLCKIINRFIEENQAPTTQFNEDVEDMVENRSGDSIKIILVDMEKGAGLDYSDNPPNPPYEGGDFWGRTYTGVSYDGYHPNDKGNTKMAVKFYEKIVKELGSPLAIKKTNSITGMAKGYPNPFKNKINIEICITERVTLDIEIINIGGVVVDNYSRICDPGLHTINWKVAEGDYGTLQSGVYFSKLTIGN